MPKIEWIKVNFDAFVGVHIRGSKVEIRDEAEGLIDVGGLKV